MRCHTRMKFPSSLWRASVHMNGTTALNNVVELDNCLGVLWVR